MTKQQFVWMGISRVETDVLVTEMSREDSEAAPSDKPKKDKRAAILRDARRLLQSLHHEEPDDDANEDMAYCSHDNVPALAAPQQNRENASIAEVNDVGALGHSISGEGQIVGSSDSGEPEGEVAAVDFADGNVVEDDANQSS